MDSGEFLSQSSLFIDNQVLHELAHRVTTLNANREIKSIVLEPFTGLHPCLSRLWLQKYEAYSTICGYTQKQKVIALPLFFTDKALTWFNAQEFYTSSWLEVRRAFFKRYDTTTIEKYDKLEDIFNRKQREDQPFQDFLDQLKFDSILIEKHSEDFIKDCVIRNVIPYIKNFILQRPHVNYDDVIQSALIAESSRIPTVHTHGQLCDSLEELKKQIAVMTLNIQSKSFKRECNDIKRTVHNTSPQHSLTYRRHINLHNSKQIPKSVSRQCSRRSMRQYKHSRDMCQRCGMYHYKTCYARNLKCYFCHKIGHIRKMCFSKRKANKLRYSVNFNRKVVNVPNICHKEITNKLTHTYVENTPSKIDNSCVNDTKHNINNLSSSTILLQVADTQLHALVDTGATHSCINDKVYDLLNKDLKFPLLLPDRHNLSSADGSILNVRGRVNLPLTIGNLQLYHKFNVITNLSQDMLLGLNFLKAHKASIDLSNNLLSLHDGMTQQDFLNTETEVDTIKVFSTHTTNIQPRTEIIIPVQIQSDINNITGILEPLNTLFTDFKLIGSRCLVKPTHALCAYRVMNPTNSEITLKQNQIIATFQTITNNNISQPLQEDIVNESVNLITDHNTDRTYLDKFKELGINLNATDLNPRQVIRLKNLLGKNRDVFATSMKEIGHTKIYQHHIDTGSHPPIRQRAYPTTPAKKKEIEKQLKEMLELDLIEPSFSPWASPCILVKKKDNTLRFCIDYRKLNAITTPQRWPLPVIDETLQSLGQYSPKYFSSLDLLSGYWQCEVDEESRPKTAFTTHVRNYSWRTLPFGLMGAPATFSFLMSTIFSSMSWKYVLIYLDDILVFSKDFEQHLDHLQAVFAKLKEVNLKLKPSKCHFALSKVSYLGHILTKDGISTDPAKIKAIQSFPIPENIHKLRSFLGLCNYYRKFIKNYAIITAPLHRLLQKDAKFEWTDEADIAFNELKQALTTAPILSFPDFNKPFILYTDASDYAIGYILGQKDDKGRERVIAYAGTSLTKSQRNYHITEKECLALVSGIKHFHSYLANGKFQVVTDHAALQFLKNIKDPKGRLARWAILLQSYDYDVIYKSGTKHGNADALSRRDYDTQLANDYSLEDDNTIFALQSTGVTSNNDDTVNNDILKINDNQTDRLHNDSQTSTNVQQDIGITLERLREIQRDDGTYTDIIQYLADNILPDDKTIAQRVILESQHYVLDEGILYHVFNPRRQNIRPTDIPKQLAVPELLRTDILKAYHDSALAGHQGFDRTYMLIRHKYFWPGMYTFIQRWVSTCLECQTAKRYFQSKKAPLKPLQITDIFQRWHIDLLGPLKETKDGYKYIFLAIDSCSKWPEIHPLKTKEAFEVAKVFYNQIICRYSCPKTILTDCGNEFTNKLLAELCKILDIGRLNTSPFHPQTNAQAERMNSVIGQELRIFCDKAQTKWAELLPSILAGYRFSPSISSTGYSPYFMLFGREPQFPIDNILPPITGNMTDHTRTDLRQILDNVEIARKIAKENMLRAQQTYKLQYDKNTKEPKFIVGQRVWLYCVKVPPGHSTKLIKKWTGPFYIVYAYPSNTYLLRNCEDHKQLSRPIHSNRLRPYFSPLSRPTQTPLPWKDITHNLNPELCDSNDPDIDETPVPQRESIEKCENKAGSKINKVKGKL